MLEKVRKPNRTRNIIAYIVFGAICTVFVFMSDIPNQFGMGSLGGPAAIVNKVPISFGDYKEAYSRMEGQFKGQLDFLPAAQRQMYLNNIRSQALEVLINSQVISQEAKNLGFSVSDEEVRDYIVKIPAFIEEEKFKRERYDSFLSYRKISSEKFETEIRKEVVNNHLRKLMEVSLEPTKLTSDFTNKLESLLVNISFAKISSENLNLGIQVNLNEVDSFVSNKDNEKAISDYFSANKSNFEEEEQVQARHILIKFDVAKAGDKEKSLTKIKEIQNRLKTEDFISLAKEVSDDPGSKDKGGDLGFFGRGSMVPEFEKVAFNSELNKVSEPVETQFGYHLIKVENKKPASSKTLEDVKSEIAKELIKEKKIESVKNSLVEKAKNSDLKALDSWLSAQKIKWEDTGDFKLSVDSIPKISLEEDEIGKIIKAAVSKKTFVNDLIVSGTNYYLVKIKSFKEEPIKSLPEEITSRIDFRKDSIVSDVFSKWAEKVKETASIERNPQIMQQ